MGVAAQNQEPVEDAVELELAATGTDGGGGAAALRKVAGERLAEHRRKRAAAQAEQQAVEAEAAERQQKMRGGASRVRDAVAARYQNSVSYREFLAQEAERALTQAQAEADMAQRKAEAVAEAQMRLLDEMQQWKQSEPGPRELALAELTAHRRDDLAHALSDIAVAATQAMHLEPRMDFTEGNALHMPELTVRLYEELETGRTIVESPRRGVSFAPDEQDSSALDEEIAFRLAPEFESAHAATVVTSGNVIEFPRQLVAARKARPRLAEGPLREESAPEPQLRIFEVEPEQISEAPAEPTSAPEWQGILLESAARHEDVVVEPVTSFAMQPQIASMELRLMAIAVDACCVSAGVIAFACVAVMTAGPRLQALPVARLGVVAGAALAVMFVLYQLLFFTLAESTPGMRFARIGLCTFADRNPTRGAMRLRVLATVVAACPLGLGLLWAWMDEDRLGWHDRMSRMYQRGY